MPDVSAKIPLVPAVLEWTTGERHIIREDDGLPKMVPMFDPMLEAFVVKHDHDMPDKMITHADQIQIIQVDQRTWDSMDILTKLKSELQQTTGAVYTENQEYREAAIKCYQAHGSPDLGDGCSDYMSESKQIGQWNYDDGEGRKITIPPQYRQYMCHLCPFAHAYVAVELRRRKGMYKEGPVMKRKRGLKRR